jgi:Ion channel
MRTGFLRELISLRRRYSDWLLTLLTMLLLLIMFVFIPLQAAGMTYFQGFGLIVLLAIIAGAMVISINPKALAVMSVAFITNLLVIGFRPLRYDVHIVSGCWLIITLTLSLVVGRAVFGRGRVTYHRIVGAVLLYLLIALAFMMLFSFVGASFDDAFRGLTFEYDSALAGRLLYFSFITLTSTGYGDIAPVHPLAQSLCSLEAIIGQLYPAILLARLVSLESIANQAQKPLN